MGWRECRWGNGEISVINSFETFCSEGELKNELAVGDGYRIKERPVVFFCDGSILLEYIVKLIEMSGERHWCGRERGEWGTECKHG